MSRLFRSTTLAMLLSFVACNGGTQTNPNAPGGVGADGTGGPGGDMEESHDVSPVAEPGPLVVHLRWKNPGANLATGARLMRLPPQFVSANVRVAVEELVGELLRDNVDRKGFAEVVDIDAPIDLVVVADTSRGGPVPEPIAAVSLGLTSLSRARDASRGRPTKLAPGVWRVGPPPEPWEGACALAASSGKTPGRLICADSEAQVARIAPYVARNVPAIADAASDIHAEVNFRPLFDKYGRQWATQARGLPVLVEEFKTGIAKFDDALIDAATALAAEAGELIHDADKIVMDVTLDETQGVLVTGKLGFAGKRSWVAKTLAASASSAGPPPDMFWSLPASSEMATFARSTDPAHYDKMLDIGRRLLEGFLEREKIGTGPDRKALAGLLRLPFKKNVATVVASGHFPKAAGSKSMLEDIVEATVGWQLFGIEDGPTAMKAYLDDMVNAYNRGGLQSFLKKEMGSDAKHLPIVKKAPAPAGLGGGSTAVEITIPKLDDPSAMMAQPPGGAAPPKPKTIDLEFHIVLMPDGQRTWVALGSDKTALGDLLKSLKGAKPGPQSLSSRSGLESLKSGKHASGAMTTVDGLLGSVKPALGMTLGMSGGASREMQQIQQALERMPNKGATPIFFFSDVTAGAKPALTFQARIPREALVDVGFLVTQAVQIASGP
jgi:hypothetical protein